MSKTNAREYAFNILEDIIINDAYSNIAINKIFNSKQINLQDKKFITELVYGTLKNKIYLEHILKHYSKVRIKSKVKVLLIMSIYQILNMDKTPNFATVNEAVNIAKKIMGNHTSKFVNGVLRTIIRTFNEKNLQYDNEKQKICIENSCPEELFNILENQYGLEIAQDIILAFNKKSENSIRYNPIKTTKEKLLKYFKDNNINAKESVICEDCILLNSLDLNDLYFEEGMYTIQDEASSLVACVLNEDNKRSMDILDTCAAPGGKSLHIASKYLNSNLTACDKYIHKLNLINKNIERLNIDNIITINQDATKLNNNFKNKFDIVICDVPCSGIGVIKNKPEIKYKITDNYIQDISKIQYSILENSINYLKPNGLLVYSTCTIDKRENEYNIKRFLEKYPNFVLEKINIDSIVSEKETGILNILPNEYNCDGFFIAKLRKLEA
ncbi:16S rRNA (cytosine(967)-C(5))-methyltransferase RsmB [Gemella sp. GH3]|uniref:16S rRNA (cytosine(967)-C(5))-methyltransferase RsmB n=1 Tax=unclassified Gemella TaxID=2624949 RepID=UPI0015D06A7B|nr:MULTISPECIES: 16S rRNA (cytosine(967)-C(5))-methyltransferase RsmB [unclassified Gemella]MBF0714382.1 16S rRNA (cytosine(967)-C(5))-methyltransferase RsmB [Gemella sp. GH3.1]NYS51334.1 16S rRNA (cytosine(967)-C(5))-methyltransferase RsmB [Gemella sp. GH3]